MKYYYFLLISSEFVYTNFFFVLFYLKMMDVWNVIVVVSRWFGGTHLGPDRFKHINTAAREAIIKGNFIVDANDNTNGSTKTTNAKKKKK